jgi:hypothetical protein
MIIFLTRRSFFAREVQNSSIEQLLDVLNKCTIIRMA